MLSVVAAAVAAVAAVVVEVAEEAMRAGLLQSSSSQRGAAASRPCVGTSDLNSQLLVTLQQPPPHQRRTRLGAHSRSFDSRVLSHDRKRVAAESQMEL